MCECVCVHVRACVYVYVSIFKKHLYNLEDWIVTHALIICTHSSIVSIFLDTFENKLTLFQMPGG